MNVLQQTIKNAIISELSKQPNIPMSWGLHNMRVVNDGVRFAVQGFLYTGDVTVILDFEKTSEAHELIFSVQIGENETCGIPAKRLVDFIDERVEKVENYEEVVKASMTPEEYAFAQSFEHVVFI